MTNSPPPDPRSPQNQPIGFDEALAVFIALTVLGGIFFWSINQGERGSDLLGTPLISAPAPAASSAILAPTDPAISDVVPVDPTDELPPENLDTTSQLPTVLPIPAGRLPVEPRSSRYTTSEQEQSTAVVPVPVSPAPATPAVSSFSDVPTDYWARSFIDALAVRNIITGFPDGTFRPNQAVTRAEYASILERAFGTSASSPTGQGTARSFKDVPSNHWAANAIREADQTQFLKGYPNGVFQPEQEISRVQSLIALANGLGLSAGTPAATTVQVYQDASQIPNYATDKVAAATQAELVVNYPETNLLKPNQVTTRADVAAFIYQALVQQGKAERLNSNYVVRP
ncbi:S-layer homology domain-containing protein [Leptolyngbya sp. FACHB-261]|uniref:S-layer homology domain-containing protein n=1 Tax=Leptolyngbya sp. FACHB-261 TaxID=2692806 RepID=UPI001681EEF6|nr:S-layer homology domain-containing protein [Leptolyngbya sp. FACHB-261]MBD2103602.1 S-layer homology domain-containing protein [Leptolyngbya sp. FACHB-261]